MEKDRIYRVEWPDGTGVYQGCPLFDVDGYRISAAQHVGMVDKGCDSNHPEPFDDPLLKQTWKNFVQKGKESRYSFGFATLEQAATWIYKEHWLIELETFGVHLYEYYVLTDGVYHGTFQSMFDKERAILVDRHPMSILLSYVKNR